MCEYTDCAMLPIFHNSQEFAEALLIAHVATGFDVYIAYLYRFEEFQPPKLVFLIDYYEFIQEHDLASYVSHAAKFYGNIKLKEMQLCVKQRRQRVLFFTAIPLGYCSSDEMMIDCTTITPLYDAECIFSAPIEIPSGHNCRYSVNELASYNKSFADNFLTNYAFSDVLKHKFAEVAATSRFNAQTYADKMRGLNELAIDVENQLFKEYKVLLLELQNRVQFIMNFYRYQAVGFERQGQRFQQCNEALCTYTSQDNAKALHEYSSLCATQHHIAQAMRDTRMDRADGTRTEDYVVYIYSTLASDFTYRIQTYLNSSIIYGFDALYESQYAECDKYQLLQDFVSYLQQRQSGILECRPLKEAQTESNAVAFEAREQAKYEIVYGVKAKLYTGFYETSLNIWLNSAFEAYKLKNDSANPIAEKLAKNVTLVGNEDEEDGKASRSRAASSQHFVLLPKDELRSESSAHAVDSTTVSLGNELDYRKSLGTPRSAVKRQAISAKSLAVIRKFPGFAEPLLPELSVLSKEMLATMRNSMALLTYHYAKYTHRKIANPEFVRSKQFSAGSFAVLLLTEEKHVVLLVVRPLAALYYNGSYFIEVSDVQVSGVRITSKSFEIRGKQLKMPSKAVEKFERGLVFSLEQKHNTMYQLRNEKNRNE